MKFVIPGIPIAKARPKFRRRGKHLQPYDPQQHLKELTKQIITQMIQSGIKDSSEFSTEFLSFDEASAFIVHLDFFFPILSTKKLNPWLFDDHTFKPDLDNCEKFYGDILSKTLIPDDKQIVELSSRKSFSLKPRTEITIMENKKIPLPDKVRSVLNIFDPTSVQEFYEDVETLQMLVHGIDFKNLENVKSEWLASTACFLSCFSYKYCGKLNKVKRIGDLSQEMENYENLKKESEKNESTTE
jgi:Holliday junction resolvase RusA-like endonuclease